MNSRHLENKRSYEGQGVNDERGRIKENRERANDNDKREKKVHHQIRE